MPRPQENLLPLVPTICDLVAQASGVVAFLGCKVTQRSGRVPIGGGGTPRIPDLIAPAGRLRAFSR
jgi:hypothetical protein